MPGEAENPGSASIDLVRRAQDGQLDAFDRLFERYYPRVRKLASLRLGPALRSRMESEDIAQEALVEAIRGFEHFELRDEGSLIHWLARIVENTIRRSARDAGRLKRDRARELALEHLQGSIASGSLCFEPAGDGPSPSEIVGGLESRERLEAALDELEDQHREVILLRYWASADWGTVAELTGRPSADAARMLYGRALLQLQRVLGHG